MIYKKICIALLAVCALLIPFTAYAVWFTANGTAGAFAANAGSTSGGGLSIVPPEPVDADIPETPSPMLGKPPLKSIGWASGIFYDPELSRVYLPPGTSADVSVETSFFYNIHKITVGGSERFHERLYINDGIFRMIDMFGKSVTVYTNKSVLAKTAADETGVYVEFTDPKDIYDAVVVIDPGHGDFDPGALGANGIYEKDIDLNISNHLLEIFEDDRILLLPTRTSDIFVTKDDRYRLATMMGDYFISIHCNADEYSANSNGIVTFFNPDETGGIPGEEMAQIVQDELVKALDRRDRGVEPGLDYRVLNRASVPAVLAEVLFMTNSEDLAFLSEPDNQNKTAEALARAIKRLPLPRG